MMKMNVLYVKPMTRKNVCNIHHS